MHPWLSAGVADDALDRVTRYWNGGCPFKTRVVDVVSAAVPCAERLIIRIVGQTVKGSDDQDIVAHGRRLMHQEAMHMRLHTRLNDRLRAQGLPIDELEAVVQAEVEKVLRLRDRRWQMGYAAALEYLGGMVSSCLLANSVDTIRAAHPTMRTLYLHHARDEVEHAHVVPRLVRASRIGWAMRALPMLHVTARSVYLTLWFTNRMLARDGIAWHRRSALLALGWWWLTFGTILPLLPHYLRFYAGGLAPDPVLP